MLSHAPSGIRFDGGLGAARMRGTVQKKLPWFMCRRCHVGIDAPGKYALPTWDDGRKVCHLLNGFCQHF